MKVVALINLSFQICKKHWQKCIAGDNEDVERKNGVSGTGILKVLSKKTSRFQSKSKSYRISFLFMVYLSIRILNGRKMLNYVRNKKE